jgi:hypothetical protein
MKTTNYTSHVHSSMKIGVQKIQETYSKTNSNDHLEKIPLFVHTIIKYNWFPTRNFFNKSYYLFNETP